MIVDGWVLSLYVGGNLFDVAVEPGDSMGESGDKRDQCVQGVVEGATSMPSRGGSGVGI